MMIITNIIISVIKRFAFLNIINLIIHYSFPELFHLPANIVIIVNVSFIFINKN